MNPKLCLMLLGCLYLAGCPEQGDEAERFYKRMVSETIHQADVVVLTRESQPEIKNRLVYVYLDFDALGLKHLDPQLLSRTLYVGPLANTGAQHEILVASADIATLHERPLMRDHFNQLVHDFFVEFRPESKVHFMTYGDEAFARARERIGQQAIDSGWFDTVTVYTPQSLGDYGLAHQEFIQRHKRGGGYWIWKAKLIFEKLKSLNQNDYLVYADAGCTLNPAGRWRFFDYLKRLSNSDLGVLTFNLTHLEKCWSKKDTVLALQLSDPEAFLNQFQKISGLVILKKNDHAMQVMEEWAKWSIAEDYHLIDDTPSLAENDPCFREHRHDQSLYSLLSKQYKSLTLPDETYLEPFPETSLWPFLATRSR